METRKAPDLLRIDPRQERSEWLKAFATWFSRSSGDEEPCLACRAGLSISVVAYLCAQALGKDRVQVVFMPEVDSSSDSLRLGKLVAELLGVRNVTEDIAPALAGARCYERQADAVRLAVPEYGPGYKFKIVLPGLADAERYSIFSMLFKLRTVKRRRSGSAREPTSASSPPQTSSSACEK